MVGHQNGVVCFMVAKTDGLYHPSNIHFYIIEIVYQTFFGDSYMENTSNMPEDPEAIRQLLFNITLEYEYDEKHDVQQTQLAGDLDEGSGNGYLETLQPSEEVEHFHNGFQDKMLQVLPSVNLMNTTYSDTSGHDVNTSHEEEFVGRDSEDDNPNPAEQVSRRKESLLKDEDRQVSRGSTEDVVSASYKKIGPEKVDPTFER
jgi:hypothetical protein